MLKIESIKVCDECGNHKRVDEFPKKGESCKHCRGLISDKIYREKNKVGIREINKNWRERNAEGEKERVALWKSENKERVEKTRRKWRKDNPEKEKPTCIKYRELNRKKINENSNKRRGLNLDKANIGLRRYRASKKNLIHPDHDKNIERVLELMRARVSECLKFVHHLDHVWPMAMGGPHHHSNLQVIPGALNVRKKDNICYKHELLKNPKHLPDHILNWIKQNSPDKFEKCMDKLIKLNYKINETFRDY